MKLFGVLAGDHNVASALRGNFFFCVLVPVRRAARVPYSAGPEAPERLKAPAKQRMDLPPCTIYDAK